MSKSIKLEKNLVPSHLFKNKNFITPNIVEFRLKDGNYYEVSYGSGVVTPKIYGVTCSENKYSCGGFESYEMALAYIDSEDDDQRTCSSCGDQFKEGYVINDGQCHYCSRDCLETEMEWEEYLEQFEEGDSYFASFDEVQSE